MYTNSTLKPIEDNALYVGLDGTQWANTDKSTIPELHHVTLTDAPDATLNNITGFHIDESYTQVWDYTPYTNVQLCDACYNSDLHLTACTTCTIGTLAKCKLCHHDKVLKLKRAKNNGVVYFVKDEVTYSTPLVCDTEDAEQVSNMKIRAMAGEWDETNDRFHCMRVSDSSDVYLQATAIEAQNLIKNCSKYQSANVVHKGELDALIEACTTISEVQAIDYETGWASSTISIGE